ncbi:hypothetical protein HW260_03950 [Helicobacter cinaedi]|uniref:Uncharacterized protein n=1 Tax=Helicobacter cinaedi CCUG 18818 = ATCC BAA-847 TaxID=537971 RepID=A0AAI8MMS2_9HELI|nr:hypothetical protein [Helicobacter cinaedi]EFR47025.1 hypothetical protein HCCG_01573 [Helicobacter cinaedi CCUG 18818 = ATCC BAA-847]QOQ91488.1 hypothetical protein HW260_03950 [Helicobacter cinaedi]BAM32484.1 hypothetical protein HCBAA847_1251 [Helicobacter cinaedi CCUG 18818 = ATCC BAA-847]
MEFYEKIIIASVMGTYLCFLIYQNRDYFTKKKSKTDDEPIYIKAEDGSKDYIEITLPKDSHKVFLRYWRDEEKRFETHTMSYDEFVEKWGDIHKEHRLKTPPNTKE